MNFTPRFGFMRRLRVRFTDRLIARAEHRKPDVIIKDRGRAYLRRWHLLRRNPVLNVYLHNFQGDDHGPELHDHPWWNLSWILAGGYFEVLPAAPKQWPNGGVRDVFRVPGSLTFRKANSPHRIALSIRADGSPVQAWTLFITGPRFRPWGFWCSKGWKAWETNNQLGAHQSVCD